MTFHGLLNDPEINLISVSQLAVSHDPVELKISSIKASVSSWLSFLMLKFNLLSVSFTSISCHIIKTLFRLKKQMGGMYLT